MSQGFKTEADVMRNTAHRVDETNQEVSAELSRLRSIVDGVRASWEGTAQVSFDNLMQHGMPPPRGFKMPCSPSRTTFVATPPRLKTSKQITNPHSLQ